MQSLLIYIAGGVGVAFVSSFTTYVYVLRKCFQEGLSEAMATCVLKSMEEADRRIAIEKAASENTEAETRFPETSSVETEQNRMRVQRLQTNNEFFVHCAKDSIIRRRVDELGYSYPWPAKMSKDGEGDVEGDGLTDANSSDGRGDRSSSIKND